MSGLVGYLVLFLLVGIGFIFVHLLVGKLVRPAKPDAEKLTIYECGEPTIGSAWVQFDLRFYVIALLFVIFDVEVAFFFPWAAVFGQANAIAKPDAAATGQVELAEKELLQGRTEERDRAGAQSYAWLALGDIAVFFAVLLVGFAYLWARGDIKWVRALDERAVPTVAAATAPRPAPAEKAMAGS